jgi:RNA polymerase sigma-32 factor
MRQTAKSQKTNASREKELVRRYRESLARGRENIHARNALLEMHLPMIRAAARSIHVANHRHAELDELINVASLGMLEGLKRFDPDRGLRVSTYCLWWAWKEMHLYMRQTRWHGSVSEADYKKLIKMHRATAKLPVRFDGYVDLDALAGLLNLPAEECQRLFALSRSMRSIEEPVSRNGKLRLADLLVVPAANPYLVAVREQVSELVLYALTLIPKEERDAILTSYFEDRDSLAETFTFEEKKARDARAYRRRRALYLLQSTPAMQRAYDTLEMFTTK